MKNVVLIIKEYLVPLIILAFFPLMDIYFSLESRLYGKVTIDTITIDVTSNHSDTLSDSLSTYDEEHLSVKDKINDKIVKEFKVGEKYYKEGNLSEAQKIWTQLLIKEIQVSILFNNLGVISSKNGEINKADSLFALSIESDSLYANAWYNRGRIASRLENNKMAIDFYKKAVGLNPQLSGGWYNLALIYLREEELYKAKECIKKAEEAGYKKDRVAYTEGSINIEMGDTINAIKSFERATKYNPSAINSRYQKASLLLAMGKEKEATLILKQISNIDKDFYLADLAIVRFKLKQKDYLSAGKLLAKLSQKYPNNISILYEEAKLLGLQGRDRDALKIYHRIAGLDNDNPRVYYNIAVNMMDIKNYKEAINAYNKALSIDPYHWLSAYNLGVYYLKNDNYKEAEKFLSTSSSINNSHVPSKYNLALTYLKMKKRAKAEELFGEVLKIDSLHVNSLYNIAMIKMSRKKNDDAEQLLTQVLNINPTHSKSLFNLGVVDKRLNNNKKALKHFEEAVKSSGGYAKASYNISLIYIEQKEIKEAYNALDEAIKDDPKYLKAYLKKADLFIQEGKYNSAIELLERAEREVGNSKKDLLSISEVYININKLDKSNVILQKILDVDKNDYKVISLLVNNFVDLNKPENAIRYLEMIPIDKRYSRTLTLAGELYRKTGNVDRAINNYKSYLLQNPKDQKVRLALAQLYEQNGFELEAAKEYKKLYKMNGNDYDLAIKTGYNYLKANSYKTSMKYYNKAQNIKPQRKTPKYYIALLLSRQNLNDSAFVAWDAFVKEYADDGRGYYQLGKIMYDQHQYENATEYFKQSIKLKEETGQYYLAECLYKTGDYKQAYAEINRYMSKKKSSKKAKKLLKLIKKHL